jgi:hypothetical protein
MDAYVVGKIMRIAFEVYRQFIRRCYPPPVLSRLNFPHSQEILSYSIFNSALKAGASLARTDKSFG